MEARARRFGCIIKLASASAAWAARQPRNRHPERRATDVGQPDIVAELHGGRVAAVLAADAQLDVRTVLRPFSIASFISAAHAGPGVDVANGFCLMISRPW